MKWIAQVFTGGWNNADCSAAQVCSGLEILRRQTPLQAVLIGWNGSTEFYREVGEFLHRCGIAMYLWLPVLSELEQLGAAQPVVDLWGEETVSFSFQKGEDFRFFCPSAPANHMLLQRTLTRFAGCGFDGVFLDKIRSQSFLSGARDILGCCCARCRTSYRQQGCDPDALRALCDEKGTQKALALRWDRQGQRFAFLHPEAEAFFAAKRVLYTQQIIKLIEEFRQKGLGVGLDLYAPPFDFLVGQDSARLAHAADFVKPMMYRITNAPAGMGFEWERMAAALGEENLPLDFDRTRLLGDPWMEQALSSLCRAAPGKIYPGLEFNRDPAVAPSTPDYLRRSLRVAENAGCTGVVMAWNVLRAPKENLDCARTQGGTA